MNKDDIIKILKTINYPNYSRDIISFGIVTNIEISKDILIIDLKLSAEEKKFEVGLSTSFNVSLFILGFIWMSFHALLLITVAKIIKAPFFFLAVGSQANVGGAASAPIVASAFHPSLAPVGVLLAVMGYAVGTYGAWICGVLMSMVSI